MRERVCIRVFYSFVHACMLVSLRVATLVPELLL